MNKKTMIWVLVIVVLAGLVLKVPLSPKYGEIRVNRSTEFKVFGFANQIEVDDNLEFVSPVTKERPFVIDLKPGDYYWKADNSFLIGKFTIQSEVNVRLEKMDDNYRVSNLGNVPVDLKINGNSFLTGAAVLDLGEKLDLDLENNSRVIVSQR